MKHLFLTAIIMALSLIPSSLSAQEYTPAYDFSAVNKDGVTIFYYILSEEEKTCGVTCEFFDWGREEFISTYRGNVVIPSSANGYKVTSIRTFTFFNCSSEIALTIPNSVKSIEQYALASSCIVDVTLNVDTVEPWLSSSSSIKKITLGDSVKKIMPGAFKGCSRLETAHIGNSVTNIGESAFSECSSIKSLNLPESLQTIGDNAFNGLVGLSSVTIPSNVAEIGVNPFSNCSSLESIIVEPDNIYYNSANNCNVIIETNTGNLVSGCKKTPIMNTITSIGASAFSSCSGLTTITIPSSVTSIGESAFSNCTNLSTIYSEVTDFFDIDASVFKGSENTTLYVPKGMATTYRSSTGWSVIKYIEEMPDDTPDASFLLSCSGKGSVSVNDAPSITNKISTADINEGPDNTFTFTPNSGCRLDQVILNGLDITANVQNGTLTCTIPANSQMIVTFAPEPGDMNHDGRIDISDVVAIVNLILGN